MSASRTEIAGFPVAELARQFGTPTFVYDAAKIASGSPICGPST